jgi:hypothetical protein
MGKSREESLLFVFLWEGFQWPGHVRFVERALG